MKEEEIKKELKEIARMLKKEYDEEPRKTIRKIYQEVVGLYNKIADSSLKESGA